MLKRVTFMRHAKSSWADPSLNDFDRPLNKRGERDAPMMGRRLLARGARPSQIITSPAKRARRTARLVAKEIGYPIEFLQREDHLYLADPRVILEVIGQQDNSFNDMIVVGHNPGLTELTNRLTGLRIDNIPTCGMAAMEADIGDWSQLADSRCRLVFFDYPRKRGESEVE